MKTMRMCALGLLAAVAVSRSVQAQGTTERIRVTKDTVTRTTSTGDVTPAPAPAPAPTPAPAPVVETRTDTVIHTTTVAEVIPVRRSLLGHNMYVGLGAGALVPAGDFRNGYGTGWNATGIIGWEPPASVLGLRGTIAYGQVKGGNIPSSSTAQNPDPQIWSVLGHAKLRVPFGGLYLLGGGGWNQIRHYNSAAFETGRASGAYMTVNNWGIDGGVGIDIPMNVASLFAEARWSRVFSSDKTTPAASANRNTSFAPIVVGFRVF